MTRWLHATWRVQCEREGHQTCSRRNTARPISNGSETGDQPMTERGRNLDGFLEMVDCLLHLASRTIHVAKDTVTFADPELITFARE